MKSSILTVLLFIGVLCGAVAAPATGGEVILESGEFTLLLDQGTMEWTAIPIDPVLDGSDWAQFYVDSGLDTLLSNGQLISERFLSNFGGYNPYSFGLVPVLSVARTAPVLSSIEIDDAALAAELNATAAMLVAMKLELIETPASGSENVPLERDLADFSFFVGDFGSGISIQMWWDWDDDDSFVEEDSTYRFKITADACETGTVNATNGFLTNVLFLNGSSGGPDRTVEVNDGDLFTVTVLEPIAGGNGRFVVHANEGDSNAGTNTVLPFDIGSACFPLLLSTGATPVIIANSVGKVNLVGESNFFGVPTEDPDPATTSFSYPDLPLGTVLTFQGVIVDSASASTKGASTMNAVTLIVI